MANCTGRRRALQKCAGGASGSAHERTGQASGAGVVRDGKFCSDQSRPDLREKKSVNSDFHVDSLLFQGGSLGSVVMPKHQITSPYRHDDNLQAYIKRLKELLQEEMYTRDELVRKIESHKEANKPGMPGPKKGRLNKKGETEAGLSSDFYDGGWRNYLHW